MDSANIGWQRNRKVGGGRMGPPLNPIGALPWASTDASAGEATATFKPRVRSTERAENISVASPEPAVSSFLEGAKPSKSCFSVHNLPLLPLAWASGTVEISPGAMPHPVNITVTSPEPATGNMCERGNLLKFWLNIHNTPKNNMWNILHYTMCAWISRSF